MALISEMGVTGNGIFQPLLKHKFRLEFINMGNAEGMKVQAISCERPKLEYEEVVLDRYNSRAYIAGKHQFDPINCVIECDIGGEVAQAIRFQHERTQHIIGLSSSPTLESAVAGEDYKFSLKIDTMDGTAGGVLETFMLDGAFIQRCDWDTHDYTVSETVKASLTIRFDHARELITGVRKNAHPAGAAF